MTNCITCKHYNEGEVDPNTFKKVAECRRYPPSVQLIPTNGGIATACMFPQVSGEFTCGEHIPKVQPLHC